MSVCNHSRDEQIERSSDFVIIRMITDRIGLYSVLLPVKNNVPPKSYPHGIFKPAFSPRNKNGFFHQRIRSYLSYRWASRSISAAWNRCGTPNRALKLTRHQKSARNLLHWQIISLTRVVSGGRLVARRSLTNAARVPFPAGDLIPVS